MAPCDPFSRIHPAASTLAASSDRSDQDEPQIHTWSRVIEDPQLDMSLPLRRRRSSSRAPSNFVDRNTSRDRQAPKTCLTRGVETARDRFRNCATARAIAGLSHVQLSCVGAVVHDCRLRANAPQRGMKLARLDRRCGDCGIPLQRVARRRSSDTEEVSASP